MASDAALLPQQLLRQTAGLARSGWPNVVQYRASAPLLSSLSASEQGEQERTPSKVGVRFVRWCLHEHRRTNVRFVRFVRLGCKRLSWLSFIALLMLWAKCSLARGLQNGGEHNRFSEMFAFYHDWVVPLHVLASLPFGHACSFQAPTRPSPIRRSDARLNAISLARCSPVLMPLL